MKSWDQHLQRQNGFDCYLIRGLCDCRGGCTEEKSPSRPWEHLKDNLDSIGRDNFSFQEFSVTTPEHCDEEPGIAGRGIASE